MTKREQWQGIPTELSLEQFRQFVLPHLSIGSRGPAPKLSLHALFGYILKLLYMGCQRKELPIAKDRDGRPEIHYTRVYGAFRRWQADGCFEAIFAGSVGAVANSVGICWRGLRLDEDIGSGSEVNWVIGGVVAEGLPSIDASHDDLTGGEQGPEQHGSGLGGGQHGLGFDPPLKLLMEPFDRVGGPRAFPLAGRQSGKGEEPVPGLLEAVGPPL